MSDKLWRELYTRRLLHWGNLVVSALAFFSGALFGIGVSVAASIWLLVTSIFLGERLTDFYCPCCNGLFHDQRHLYRGSLWRRHCCHCGAEVGKACPSKR